ncbi:MAG: tRNA (adenosine(37)-N6)-threonylcarbamoyltransferase complex dimerization subunit type 1 TsaB [Xanthobacteraceae bacterium]|jgi:tRNA threonylcarbamoyladenosine biosynthesis protein TsaB|nr:tRNA (adenosine(37)-N6)-threonylcarbamoyltransferase complex dimerization subunit type 1 TsaB [Xanthobacteraceae bacterium]MBV9632091.1 tRNA (adenosine(37)-N6)-threonylcarbamoyltransferase complex dimerization subunit type 1 TsaB [Xanthobacteraceae bacterium]
MLVLALDTALAACSAAVFDSQRGLLATKSIPMLRGHAEALLPLVEQVMDAAGVAFSSLDRIAVTVGPGSFTGLRVGVSAARGIALAASKPAVGVTTLAAFAAPAQIEMPILPVLAIVDARHAQVYAQAFGESVTTAEPRITSLHEALEMAPAGPLRIAGNAAAQLAASWPTERPPPASVADTPAPNIEWVARLGVVAEVAAPPKPLYLRAPDARPQARQLPHQ